MLVLTDAPSQFTPSTLGRPLRWKIRNDELVQQAPQAVTYIFSVTDSGQGAGIAFRLRGEDFQTNDPGIYYGPGGFDHSQAQHFRSAFYLAHFLRQASAFRGFTVRTERPDRAATDQTYRVIATAQDDTAIGQGPADDNDVSALSGITLEYFPAITEQRLADRLYYRLHNSRGLPVGPEHFAPYDSGAEATVDVQSIVRDLVSISPPRFGAEEPYLDEAATQRFTLRYGTYRPGGAGEGPQFGSVYESEGVPVVAALFQPWETEAMRPYGPDRGAYAFLQPPRLPWLTVRPNERYLDRDQEEFTAIYLGADPYGQGRTRRRLRYRFFLASSPETPYLEGDKPMEETGLWVVPTPGKLVAEAEFLGSRLVFDRLEVSVEIDLGFFTPNYVQESEVLTIRPAPSDDCAVAELYLLEGRGSWLTLPVKSMERRVATEATAYASPLRFSYDQRPLNPATPFAEGGTGQQYVTGGTERFLLRTGLVRRRVAKLLESVIGSAQGYLRFTDEDTGRRRTLKVSITPGDLPLYRSDGAERLELTVESTAEIFTR